MPAGADAGPAVGGELPEVIAAQSHLEALEELDSAVDAMQALQDPATADARHLRVLANYTLGAEVPGRLSRSASLFGGGLKPADPAARALGIAHLQYAVRCSVGKAMAALDTRLFERNDLLATETVLAQRAGRLFAPGVRPLPYAETMQGLREVLAALDDEEAMLARGDYAWLQGSTPSLGPLHEALLERGIPSEQPEKIDLCEAPAVQDVVALLDALVSTRHDLSLARALKSPLCGWSDDDLAQLARLRLRWTQRADLAEYERIFGCPVEFETPQTELWFDAVLRC